MSEEVQMSGLVFETKEMVEKTNGSENIKESILYNYEDVIC